MAHHIPPWLFGFDHRIFFESARDFRVDLESKKCIRRYRHARRYLKEAKKALQIIEVRSVVLWFIRDNILSLPCRRACNGRVWVL